MSASDFFKAIRDRNLELALEYLDEIVEQATLKASQESKAAGLRVYDGHLKRHIGPEEPDPYVEQRARRAKARKARRF